MVFLTAGFWRHCLMAILMQSVFRRLTVMQLCNVDVLPFVFTRLLKALTLTRNAPSLEMSPFAVVFSLVSSTPCLNAMNLIPLNVASQEFYLTLWLYTKTAHYKFRDKLGCSDCCCFFVFFCHYPANDVWSRWSSKPSGFWGYCLMAILM